MSKYLIIALLFNCQFSFGQKTGFSIVQIDSIVKYIDSNAVVSSTSNFIMKKTKGRGKGEGTGRNKYYVDPSKNKLLKVVSEFAFYTDNKDQYYFWEGSLIYVSAAREIYVGELDITTSTTQFYYQNDSLLLYRKGKAKALFTAEEYLKIGRSYLSDSRSEQ